MNLFDLHQCKSIQEELKAHLDGELGWWATRVVESHLRRCPDCRREQALLTGVGRALRSLPARMPAETFRDALLQKLPAVKTTHHASETDDSVHSILVKNRKGASRMIRLVQVAVPLAIATSFVFMLIAVSGRKARDAFVQVNPRMSSTSEGVGVWNDENINGALSPAGEVRTNHIRGGATASGKRRLAVQAPADYPDPLLRIIRNADLTLEVRKFQPQWDRVAQIARSVGGYVGESVVDKDDEGRLSGSITVRVPEKMFESALERISDLGKIESKKLSSQDVSQEYTDTEARLRQLRRQEGRLLALLDRARTLNDVLRLEGELNRVRGELEQSTGRVRWLSNATSYSTVNVSMHEPIKKKPATKAAGWTFKNEVTSAYAALKDALRIALVVGIWAIVYVPFYVVLLLLAMLGYRKATRSANVTA